MPTLVILGVIFTIVLVFITGITLTNSINISNIIKLREKVASDSAAANSANAAQTRAALVEQQYSTLQQHHLSRSDLNYITANHPKNLQRFQQNTANLQPHQQQQQQQQVEQQQPTLPHISATNSNNKIIIEIGISNYSLPQQKSTANSSNNATSSVSSFDSNTNQQSRGASSESVQKTASVIEDLVAPLNGAIIDGHIESISVPATSEIRQQLNETLKYFGGNAQNGPKSAAAAAATTTSTTRPPLLATVTSTFQNETTLNSSLTGDAKNITSNAVVHLPLTKAMVSSSSSSLATQTFEGFLNNSLNSTTSSAVNASSLNDVTISPGPLAATVPPASTNQPSSGETVFIGSEAPAAAASPLPSSSSVATNQLSIEDHNPGMIDFEKRNYVKKVT